jgi:hypothetical protein
LDNLREFGIFVVPVGEVECWLSDLAVKVNRSDWTAAMLDRLGADEESPTFVRPDKTDVWDFVRSIGAWITDPLRKGVPTEWRVVF